MQVYAAALVYNAMRVAQGEVAHAAGLSPEDLSPAKLYPKFAAACYTYVVVQYAEHTIRRQNPQAQLRPVNWRRERWASLPVPTLCVEPRHGIRRKRRYCPARRHWKSLKHVRGGRRFLAKLS